ncbi:MAG: peptide deformylase [Methylococcales bacterium]|nr:peptide deformylase [Methylococcales bacterium]
MSILTVLEFPDKRLRTKAKKATVFDEALKTLVDDMLETMYDFKGIGLAATQINIHKQIIVIDVSEEKNQPLCLINPEILEQQGEEESEEGCLSVPGFFENITRAEHIKIKAWDKQGEPFELEADELLSICIQHEMDHLQGKLFVDYLSPLKKQRIKSKLEKIHKQQGKK